MKGEKPMHQISEQSRKRPCGLPSMIMGGTRAWWVGAMLECQTTGVKP